jgi:hypothetical protein
MRNKSQLARQMLFGIVTVTILGCGGAGFQASSNPLTHVVIADRVNGRVVSIDAIPYSTWDELSGSVAMPELLDELISVDYEAPYFYVLTRQGKIVRYTDIFGAGYVNHGVDLTDGEGDIQVMPSGEMYVTRADSGEIWYFSSWTAMPTAATQTIGGAWLGKLVVGSTGRIFVSDEANSRIYELASISATPTILVDATTLVTPANLDNPKGLHFDETNNRLLICDSNNSTIDVLDLGSSLYTNGSWTVNQPIDIHFGVDGLWYITYVTGVASASDPVSGAKPKFTGSLGSNPGQFSEPWSVVTY